MSQNQQNQHPSRDQNAAEKLHRMMQPDALKKNEPLVWSTGLGTDVWEMFCSAITGDLQTIKRLLDKDVSLVRGAYDYRTPLYFAVRENQLEVAAFLIVRGADPTN